MYLQRQAGKRTWTRALGALLALSLLGTPCFASSKSSGSRGQSDLERACAEVLAEAKAGRAYIADLEASNKALRAEVAAADRVAALTAEESRLKSERIANLSAQIERQDEMIRLAREHQKDLESDLARVMKERDRANGRNKVWAAVGFGLGVLLTALAAGGN